MLLSSTFPTLVKKSTCWVLVIALNSCLYSSCIPLGVQRKVFYFFGEKKNLFYFLNQYHRIELWGSKLYEKYKGTKERQIKKIKSIFKILNKNVEHKSSQWNFNKHFIQGLNKKEQPFTGQSTQKNVLWHWKLKEAIVVIWGIYRTFKILNQ